MQRRAAPVAVAAPPAEAAAEEGAAARRSAAAGCRLVRELEVRLFGRDDLLLALQLDPRLLTGHRLDHAVVALPRALGDLHNLAQMLVLHAAPAPTPAAPIALALALATEPLAAVAKPAAAHGGGAAAEAAAKPAAEAAAVGRAAAKSAPERRGAGREGRGRLRRREAGCARRHSLGDSVVGRLSAKALVLRGGALSRDDAHLARAHAGDAPVLARLTRVQEEEGLEDVLDRALRARVDRLDRRANLDALLLRVERDGVAGGPLAAHRANRDGLDGALRGEDLEGGVLHLDDDADDGGPDGGDVDEVVERVLAERLEAGRDLGALLHVRRPHRDLRLAEVGQDVQLRRVRGAAVLAVADAHHHAGLAEVVAAADYLDVVSHLEELCEQLGRDLDVLVARAQLLVVWEHVHRLAVGAQRPDRAGEMLHVSLDHLHIVTHAKERAAARARGGSEQLGVGIGAEAGLEALELRHRRLDSVPVLEPLDGEVAQQEALLKLLVVVVVYLPAARAPHARPDVLALGAELVGVEELRRRPHAPLRAVLLAKVRRQPRHQPHPRPRAVHVDVDDLPKVVLVVVVAPHAYPRAGVQRLLVGGADAHHVGHLARRDLRDAVKEAVEALRRLAHVRLLEGLDVDVALDLGAERRLDGERRPRLRRVEVLLHQRDDEHLLAARLALEQPQLRVARGVGELLEARVLSKVLVVVPRALVGPVLVPLAHLRLELGLLRLPPLRVEPPVLALDRLGVDGVAVVAVGAAVALLLLLVLLLGRLGLLLDELVCAGGATLLGDGLVVVVVVVVVVTLARRVVVRVRL
mmetsp:Transcript_21761/g.61904  ORF Transcript_21761/g.61904 Transcript_21761/m.61904 type:complete len:809 (-) Transcript_21761:40-2466(-)